MIKTELEHSLSWLIKNIFMKITKDNMINKGQTHKLIGIIYFILEDD